MAQSLKAVMKKVTERNSTMQVILKDELFEVLGVCGIGECN